RPLEAKCVRDSNDELAHRLRRQQRVSTLRTAEAWKVDRHQMGGGREARPRRLVGEYALRPRAEEQRVGASRSALRVTYRQSVDDTNGQRARKAAEWL